MEKPFRKEHIKEKQRGSDKKYLLIVSISVESVTLRSMKLNSRIIDHFYATLLIKKAQWAHPTVYLKAQESA